MKKLILAIVALGFTFANTPVMAAGANPPKALCLDFTSFTDFHQLVIKSMGTVQTSGGVTKMFNITGHAFGLSPNYPVGGSGYVAPGTTTFHASYTGNGRSGSTNNQFNWELFFDLPTSSGLMHAFFQFEDGSSFTTGATPVAVVATSCASLPIAGAPARGGVRSVGQE